MFYQIRRRGLSVTSAQSIIEIIHKRATESTKFGMIEAITRFAGKANHRLLDVNEQRVELVMPSLHAAAAHDGDIGVDFENASTASGLQPK